MHLAEKYYQSLVSSINESVMEDSQALISPYTYKLGDSQKSVREKKIGRRRFKRDNLSINYQESECVGSDLSGWVRISPL